MDSAFKWIGGGTAAVLALLGAALVAANAPEDRPHIEPETVLDMPAALPEVATETPAETQVAAADVSDNPFVIKRILPIDGPIKYGEWHWDDAGVPDGPLLITVDLDARVASVFRGGYEIGAAAVLLGTDEHPTPLGTFPIMSKERHNISEKYNNAPMPWTLRLTSDGVAIHGGSTVENGYASHGCIGTPDGFAEKLFAIAKVGDKVIITRGKMVGLGASLAGG
ncbi:hypothetical protein MB02_01380 [Croceicoccus estronivorus]|uniref:L,D-transpeptidase family protein n=1 Tax=Croceicoccus estronivorus TaxID=1172626 RepID=UPI00083136F4|nr:L,D-transpeptidase family protein [Croceicoccus estronivorus]OCC25349.1 hypothetical protein MB02_01380 [Croceicoccus estronivorus]